MEAITFHMATSLSFVAGVCVLNEVSKLLTGEMLQSGYEPLVIRLIPYVATVWLSATGIFGGIIVCLVSEK
jgi:hypothetical protein